MNLGFISDLHLSETDTSLTNAFVDFLKSHSSNLDQLYILGDLYEVWIGDDDSSSLITSTKDALSKASKAGLEIFFIHGNRDFLLDSSFAESTGISLLPDPFFFDYFGKKLLFRMVICFVLMILNIKHSKSKFAHLNGRLSFSINP